MAKLPFDKFGSPLGGRHSSVTSGNKVSEFKDALRAQKNLEDQPQDFPPEDQELTEKTIEEGSKEPPQHLDLEKKLEEAQLQAKEEKERTVRLMAEFDNFRKRLEREKDEMTQYSNEKLIKEILPVLDSLELTVQHASQGIPEPEAKNSLVAGVEMVLKQFQSILEKFGVQQIGKEGEPFDPHQHEAVNSVESGDYKKDTVMTVHRKGYKLQNRLVRPVLVTVAKASS